jgi:hypothetical protein
MGWPYENHFGETGEFMRLVSRDFAQQLLSDPVFASFWAELGGPVRLPDSLHYLYEPEIALFIVEPLLHCQGIHVAAYPACRGKRAVKAGKEAIGWVLGQSGKALARIRRNQPEAGFYAAQCGMKRYSHDATHIYYEASSCQ